MSATLFGNQMFQQVQNVSGSRGSNMRGKGSYSLKIPFKTRVLNFFRRAFIISGADKLLAKFTRNQAASSLLVKLIPPNYLYQSGTNRVSCFKGLLFDTDISDSMGHVVYFGIRDPAQQRLFALAKPGMTILDVGTNIGFTAFNLGEIAGSSGSVYGFEPDSYNFQQAKKNLQLNDLPSVHLHNMGLADKPGTANLVNVNEQNRGMLRILQPGGCDETMQTTEIRLTTLDAFAETNHLASISLIKIDVEGYEMNVLKGAHNSLIKHRPILFIEVDDRNLREQDTTPLELIGYLQILGYRVCNAVNNGEINQSADLDGCHIDIIATPKSK